MKLKIRGPHDAIVATQEERVKMKLLVAARPDDVARIAQMLGGDSEMAAFFIVKDGGDVEACRQKLEVGLEHLAKKIFADAKARTPIDTGLLKSVGGYAAGKIRGAMLVDRKRKAKP